MFDEQKGVGHWPTVVIVAVIIALITAAHFFLKLNAVLAFWLAYILTRPLGARSATACRGPRKAGGLGLGTTRTSVIFLVVILVLVVFLAVTKVDRTERVEQHEPDELLDQVSA
ncbi:MAG: hypothetical protein ABIQ59_01040 [Nocardioidaceae bacterium]